MEYVEVFDFFPDTDELDGTSRNPADRECRTAARIAVEFRKNHAGKLERVIEVFCHRNRLLSERGIRDKKNFRRLRDLPQTDQLLNHLRVDLKPASGIKDQVIHKIAARLGNRILRDKRHIGIAAFGINRNSDLFTENFQLVNGGRAVNVARDHHHLFIAFLETERKFGAGRGLAASVKADHHDDVRRLPVRKRRLGTAHELHQFIINDLDRLLSGRNTAENRLAEAFRGNGTDKFIGDLDIDVRFQQGVADIVHCRSDI